MRSAEMYLIAAEALAREGRLEEAVNPLNTLRNARGLADYDLAGKTQERLVDDILLERRRELWHNRYSSYATFGRTHAVDERGSGENVRLLAAGRYL